MNSRLLEVAPHDDPALEHLLEHRSLERPCTAGREDLVRAPAGGRHRRRRVPFDENDRCPLERDEATQLADEGAERRVELERRGERAGDAVRRLEDVGAPGELVAEPFRLGGARDHDLPLGREPVA